MVLNWKAVVETLGILLLFLAVALLAPLGVSLLYKESIWWSFGVTAVLAGVIGVSFRFFSNKGSKQLEIREGFAVVALSWFVLSLIGALPFVLSGVLSSYSNAFFETMSGFTTTGATILGGIDTPQIEELPNSLLFWRSLTHWLGGMGIIVLTLAIMPVLGIGGVQLYKAEVPGLTTDKLTPRIGETAKRLWLIYVGFTVVQIGLLWPAIGFFDSINHAFATMATGGFSTKNGSVGQFESAYVEWIIIVFMILAGVNFALHFRLLAGQFKTVWKDAEIKVYFSIVAVSTLVLTLYLWAPGGASDFLKYEHLGESFRQAAFQAVAIITTTGFGTADYELWPFFAMSVLFLLFFAGGMAGSTGGGIKIVRHILLFKNVHTEIKKLVHPNAVIPIRLNRHSVSQDIMRNVLSFFFVYFALIGLGTLVMTAMNLDVWSAFTVTISSIGNVGPAFGDFGPTETYAPIPAAGKWVLSLLMMAGRLELFTVLILFSPAFWRR
ncbi:MAG: TrkH family potassium uptake protein [Rhodothermaceae bacterium]|nr:TrkH family potassium uptake protein [Rhodothermaceae bacterium]